MLWGTDDVWVDVIMVLAEIMALAHGCSEGTDGVWVDVIIVLAHGCSVERMRSGWTLYGLPMDAREQAGNYQVCTRLFPYRNPKPLRGTLAKEPRSLLNNPHLNLLRWSKLCNPCSTAHIARQGSIH